MNQGGLVIFRPDSEITTNSFHQAQWMRNLLTDQQWDVSHGRYESLQHIKLFKNAETLNLTQLKLRWTLNKQILKDISCINFPYLKQLFLNGNNITSIQPLIQVSLPELEVLNFKQNNILSIGSLRRCIMPKLKQISLYKNKINDIDKISQLHNKKLQKIWYNGKLEQGNLIISVTWLAKLQSNNVKQFIINHVNRIDQSQAYQKLNKKMKNKIKYEYSMVDDRHLNWI